jgi:hypothetical protein
LTTGIPPFDSGGLEYQVDSPRVGWGDGTSRTAETLIFSIIFVLVVSITPPVLVVRLHDLHFKNQFHCRVMCSLLVV